MSHHRRPRQLSTDELFDVASGRADAALRDRAETLLARNPLQRDHLTRLSRSIEGYRGRSDEAAAVDPALADKLIDQACAALPSVPRHRWPQLLLVAAVLLAVGVVALRYWSADPDRADSPAVRTLARQAGQTESYQVAEQTRIRADAGHPLSISVGSSVRLTLQPNGRLHLRHSRRKHKTVVVEQGRSVIAVRGRAADEQVRIETPSGTVEVSGTVLMVAVEDNTTRVAVSEGRTRFVSFDGRTMVVAAKQELVVSGRLMELLPLQAASRRTIARHSPDLLPDPTRERRPIPAPPPPPVTNVSSPAAATPATSDPPAPPSRAQRQRRRATVSPGATELYVRAERAMAQGRPHRAKRLLERIVRHHRSTPLATLALFERASLLERQLSQPQAAARAYCDYLALGPRATLRPEAGAALRRLGWSGTDITACATTARRNPGRK